MFNIQLPVENLDSSLLRRVGCAASVKSRLQIFYGLKSGPLKDGQRLVLTTQDIAVLCPRTSLCLAALSPSLPGSIWRSARRVQSPSHQTTESFSSWSQAFAVWQSPGSLLWRRLSRHSTIKA